MKIAMVTGSYPPQPCGVGDYTFQLVRELQTEGVEVNVVTTFAGGRQESPEVRYTVENWKVKNWREAVEWISSQGYDLVHIQYPARFYGYLPDLALLSHVLRRKMPRTPIVVTLHEFSISHLLRKLTVAALTPWADCIIVTAQSEQNALGTWMPWTRRKLHRIHMAPALPKISISNEECNAIRLRYGIGERDIVVGYSGFLHPNKGIERLIEAYATVRRDCPSARLLMLSLLEPERNAFHKAVVELVSRLQLEADVTFTGFLDADSLSRHLGIVDIGVVPYEEGVSLRRLSFITMLQHGVATITTHGAVAPAELGLQNEENVLLVPSRGSASEVARAMQRLITSPDLRRRLQCNGMSWAAQFQWSTVIQETRALYVALLQARQK